MSGRSVAEMRAARRGARLPVLDSARPHGHGHEADDLTGETFGSLTVTQRAANDARGKARWVCRCTCERLRVVLGRHLRNGEVTTCGTCVRARPAPERAAVVVPPPPPPPSQPRPAARMLPIYQETSAHRCDRTAAHAERTAANAVALAWGVERRDDCANYLRDDGSGCLALVPHTAVDARCPRNCPGYETDGCETRESRLIRATQKVDVAW